MWRQEVMIVLSAVCGAPASAITPRVLWRTAAVSVGMLAAVVHAAQPWERNTNDAEFRVNSDLVLVPVTVTDHRGASVTGLTKQDFTVLDDQRVQPISAFYSEDAPCSVGLVVDVSGSVQGRLQWEKEAVYSFLRSSNPEDQFFLTTVSSSPTEYPQVQGNPQAVEDQLRPVNSGGRTALFDSVYVAAERLRRIRSNCRALLVLSDGMDNYSRWTRTALMRMLVEADIQVYTVVIQDARPTPKTVGFLAFVQYQNAVNFMSELSEKTGGLSVSVQDVRRPGDAMLRMAAALRNRYVIGYRSPDGNVLEKWHTIRVKIARKKTQVSARSGYRTR
jgi:Ca-activated chloride channel family protein